ncbi:hypothetical protein [Streptomyces sp. SID3343]|uniref:hypothetical protein n=1 Tax=Streptomyces sp. SID3343 TaxID=2690260 RepID=UPI00136F7197|nr:hypothetical protein [Streptomyces sp. SID3343]MYW00951.1 hypothetical protein [Streptomyces sp. SID3343]
MKTRRRAAALAGVAVLGAVALTGCDIDKPTPIVTMVSGDTSAHTEAECYAGKEVPADKLESCIKTEDLTKISATVGGSYRIGVDKKIADHGWTVLIDGKPINAIFHSTYGPQLPVQYFQDTGSADNAAEAAQAAEADKSVVVHVIEQSSTSAPIKGVWAFKVEKKQP